MCPLGLTTGACGFPRAVGLHGRGNNERLLCAGGRAPRVRRGQPRCAVLWRLLPVARGIAAARTVGPAAASSPPSRRRQRDCWES